MIPCDFNYPIVNSIKAWKYLDDDDSLKEFLGGWWLKKFRLKSPKVLYGGSVNPKNVKNFKKINIIDGFLVGGASQDPKKFVDIVKKTFN